MSKISKAMRKLRDPHYQGRRNPLEKWIQIKDRIDPRARNIVDIGCNLGHIANAACDSGYLCLGVDVKSGVIQAARKTFSDNKELAFMAVEDSLESLEKLPTRDVSFLFSVHHQFYRYHGRDGCKNFLKEIAEKSRYQLFFQVAAIQSKYGEARDLFIDNDQDSVLDFNMKLLREAGLTEQDWDFDYVGKAPETENKEPYRYMIEVRRKGA